MLPGRENSRVKICGHMYVGGVVYDNAKYNLPEEEIKIGES